MNKQEMAERELEFLQTLQKKFEENSQQCVLTEAEGNTPAILRVDHMDPEGTEEELMGEYFFYPFPSSEEGDLMYFTSLVTLSDSMNEKNQDTVRRIFEKVNFILPIGAFIMDTEGGTFSYRNVSVLDSAEEKEKADKMILINASTAIAEGKQWLPVFMAADAGALSFEDFMEEIANGQA